MTTSQPATVIATTTEPVKVAIIGCGSRGTIYSRYALVSDKMQVVAIADPSKARAEKLQSAHNIPNEQCHSSWETLLEAPKIADAALICTIDSLHEELAVAFANKGYHILLEKPMATNLAGCQAVYSAVKRNGVMLAVCHVLRYTPYNRKIKQIIESGVLGSIVGIQHTEPVGHYHFAHSYVRGNWRNEAESSFSLMTKSCHDIDIIMYFLGNDCKRVSSFGGISHFKPEKKPLAAAGAMRCMDCAHEAQCPYSAKKIYLRPAELGHKKWPVDVITDVVDIESVAEALRSGPYGRCVYECDNDVCDNQVVNMEFDDCRYASFSMVAFTKEICVRKTRIFGTLGELIGDGDMSIEVYDFLSQKSTFHRPEPVSVHLGGHGGGDMGIIEAFVNAVATRDSTLLPSNALTSLDASVVVFAAEEARRRGVVVDLNEYRRQNDVEY
ncbi:hypothetical protein GGH94_001174 [Coemansia aciculifera]|uniref:NAD(P)-binding protein n=1 Tax=Coemansia aciculifera TaxID=417176 RepID=A0A9W8M588_9FUNG|nr:hypothetical protein GGH94_001174 [Coemansia aciculifera]KAJ2884147.1 hypothetical protein H4R27_002308 [Coemansia aciculifera]